MTRLTIILSDLASQRLESFASPRETASRTCMRLIHSAWNRTQQPAYEAQALTIDEVRAEYHRLTGHWPEETG